MNFEEKYKFKYKKHDYRITKGFQVYDLSKIYKAHKKIYGDSACKYSAISNRLHKRGWSIEETIKMPRLDKGGSQHRRGEVKELIGLS